MLDEISIINIKKTKQMPLKIHTCFQAYNMLDSAFGMSLFIILQ